jgi:hypothetical protein
VIQEMDESRVVPVNLVYVSSFANAEGPTPLFNSDPMQDYMLKSYTLENIHVTNSLFDSNSIEMVNYAH